MHPDEIYTDRDLVRRLLEAQFPQWAGLPIKPVPPAGTDNALYRLGDDMVVRLPRIHWATGNIEKEHEWLPKLAPLLPLKIPVPIAKGEPGEGYPWNWSIYPWLEGENATIERIAHPDQAAADLAEFIIALQRTNTSGGPRPGPNERGVPLAMRDTPVREAVEALQGMIDTDAVTGAWEAALDAPTWGSPPVWIHGDLSSGNLLAVQGRISAVIDFGSLNVGDPASDLIIAWTLFSGNSRETFREALSVDEATWERGRGWALSWALIFIPYYLNTNPEGVGIARHAIDEVLADYKRGA